VSDSSPSRELAKRITFSTSARSKPRNLNAE
jgi:hypothetical protein